MVLTNRLIGLLVCILGIRGGIAGFEGRAGSQADLWGDAAMR